MIRRFTKHLLVRYVISGGVSALVDLSLLYLFNLYTHYLIAAAFAFALAFSVSFTLQKFWTFKDLSTDGIHKQTVISLGTSLFVYAVHGKVFKCPEFLKSKTNG